jgi:hypothetical protein
MARKKKPVVHSRYYTYVHYRCRCPECKQAAHDIYVKRRGPTEDERAEELWRKLGLLGGRQQ